MRGLFNVKAIFVEEQYRYYLTHSWEGGLRVFLPFTCVLLSTRKSVSGV